MFPSVVGHRYASRAVPAAGGAAPPTPSGTILLDTRAGGAHDITVATSLANALSITGLNNSTSPASLFTTSGPSPSGRAFAYPWTTGQANSLYLEKAGLTVFPTLCYSFSTWYGAVSGDGLGFGSVGVYEHFAPLGSGQSHKHAVIFRKDPGHTPAVPNDERITIVYGKDTGSALRGFFLDVDGQLQALGTGAGGSTATDLHDISQNFVAAGVAIGSNIHIYAGTGASATWAAVTSVGATDLGVASWPNGTPDGTSQYRVLKQATTEYFQDDPVANPNGVQVATNLDSYLNQVVTYVFRLKAESAPLAGDGTVEMWFNGTRIFGSGPIPLGDLGFGDLQGFGGGPTWNAPGPIQNQLQYIWDKVVWAP